MKTAADYRQHAQDCRVLAKQMPEGPPREQLLEMARTWEQLAEERLRAVSSHPNVDTSPTPTEGSRPSKR